MFQRGYPQEPLERLRSWAYQLQRFLTEMKVGDTAVTSDPAHRLYWVGAISGGYEWAPGLVTSKPHVRRVDWAHTVARDALSATAKHRLNAIQGLYRIADEVAAELLAHRH